MRHLAGFLLLILAAGCSGTANPSGSASAAGQLVVTYETEQGARSYIEGYVPFLTATRDGDEVFTERMRFDQRLTRNLPAGAYKLTFVVHPCDANCGLLDPATETCSASFTIAAGQTVRAHAVERPSKSCSMRIST